MLHDAEDFVHPLELRLFDRLVERAAVVQLPVLPLPDPQSRWISGHYADEFAESHIKELVVREAVGAAIPLAGVGCAIERGALDRLAAAHGGKPFAGGSLTEDYELGLRLGALGLKTMFVRIPATPGQPRGGRQPRPFPRRPRRRGAPEGALDRRDRARRLGPARLVAAGSASAGCGCATGAGRSPPCCSSPAMSPLLLWLQIAARRRARRAGRLRGRRRCSPTC